MMDGHLPRHPRRLLVVVLSCSGQRRARSGLDALESNCDFALSDSVHARRHPLSDHASMGIYLLLDVSGEDSIGASECVPAIDLLYP